MNIYFLLTIINIVLLVIMISSCKKFIKFLEKIIEKI